jgi:hypothetical protein
MSFLMLAKSYKGLLIVKAKAKSPRVSLGAVISLEMSVMLTWLSIVESHWMMRKPTCV